MILINRRNKRSLSLGLKSRFFLAAAVLAAAFAPCPSGIAQTTGVVTVLHSFDTKDGTSPYASLVQASDGNFYGTTGDGGDNNDGTVYRFTPAGAFTVLHTFADARAGGSGAGTVGLIQGADGNLYGMTRDDENFGGSATIYTVSTSGVYTTLLDLSADTNGSDPHASLVQGIDGKFYGTTSEGGDNGSGLIFSVTPGGVVTSLYSFSAFEESNDDGARPGSSLIQLPDGNFYGTAASAGPNGSGTVFMITPDGVFTVLHAFSINTDGAIPRGLVLGPDSNLYGTTYNGGKGTGTLFKLTQAGVFTTLHVFGALDANRMNTDGGLPAAAPTFGADGNLYGTTQYGGAYGSGTAYQLTTAGVFATLHSFGAKFGEGSQPESALIKGADGVLYGTTYNGGSHNGGTIYSLTLSGVTPPSPTGMPVVSLTATTPSVSVGNGGSAVFTVALSAAQDHDIVVSYVVKGSGVNGADYVLLKGTKKFKAGKTSKPIKVIPQGNLGGASKKTVVLTLAAGDGYTVGTTAKVKVKIVQ